MPSEKGEISNNKEYRLTQTDLDFINFAIELEKHQKALEAGEPENSVLIHGEQPLGGDLMRIPRIIVRGAQEIYRWVRGTNQNMTEAFNSLIGKQVDENLSLEELISMRDTLKKEMEAAKENSSKKD